jgi:hypothetical protein
MNILNGCFSNPPSSLVLGDLYALALPARIPEILDFNKGRNYSAACEVKA